MRWIRRALRRPSGLILLYHRVADLESDPQRLAVSPRHFAQHLDVVKDFGRPMPVRDLPLALSDREPAGCPIAVTFDDGYGDVAACGGPLLARSGVRATVFVTTSGLGTTREFWWDDLERLLLLPGRLPETLRLRVGSRVHEWRLGEASDYSEADRRRDIGWHVECPHNASPRHGVYRDLCRLLRGVTGDERTAALDELSAAAGVTSQGRPTHRMLSVEELIRMETSGVFEVGAHTTSHSALSALSVPVQRAEIAGSKACLEEVVGHDVTTFAYPFGGRGDFTPASVSLVRDFGVTLACTNVGGLVRRRTDSLQLPRMLVRNWDGDTFAARLREWLGRGTSADTRTAS